MDEQIYLSSSPARRGWYANILKNPAFTFHLKHHVRADLPAIGTAVRDPRQREVVFRAVIADLNQPWNPADIPQPVAPLGDWMAGSPLVRVDFQKGAGT